MAFGNPDSGQFKLGPIFSPRVDPEAAAALAKDPLANVQYEKPTTGVGGFFRRLLGDNANERNAARAASQEELRLQKWLIDKQTEGQMNVANKQHEFEMARDKARAAANEEAIRYQAQLGLMSEQQKNAWALENAAKAARQQTTAEFDRLTGIVGDPIKASMLQERMLTVPLALQEAQAADEMAAAQGTGRYAPPPAKSTDVFPAGMGRIDGKTFFTDSEGKPVFLGASDQGVDIKELEKRTMAMTAAKERQNKIDEYKAPPTVFGGLAEAGGELAQGALTAGKSALGYTFPNVKAAAGKVKSYADVLKETLLKKDREAKARKLQLMEAQNTQTP